MKIPARLMPLLDVGLIDDVIRPLMSGKEAAVYLVEAGGELRVAKVYKDAQKRSFKHRADYTEGRKVRNSRRQRAMEKRSRYGREELEAAWRTAEVDAIRRLREAGVAVPEPFEFYEGVLVMELIEGEPGLPAPRLIDVALTPPQARAIHRVMMTEIIKMLCAGVVHGDLSDFNVLLREDGPVIIDFPQAVDPSFNNNAKKLFIRDVDNISSFLARFAPELGRTRYGKEIWQLYENGLLDPEVELTGSYTDDRRDANVGAILDEIDAARDEAFRKRGEFPPPSRERSPGRRGEPPPSAMEMAAEGTPRRREVYVPPPSKDRAPADGRKRKSRRRGGGNNPSRRGSGPSEDRGRGRDDRRGGGPGERRGGGPGERRTRGQGEGRGDRPDEWRSEGPNQARGRGRGAERGRSNPNGRGGPPPHGHDGPRGHGPQGQSNDPNRSNSTGDGTRKRRRRRRRRRRSGSGPGGGGSPQGGSQS